MADWSEILHTLTEVTAPSVEPVATSEAKAFLRVDHSTQDTLIAELVKAARTQVEQDTGRSLINTTWDLTFDEFPASRAITLARLPLVSVTHIKSYDEDDAATTLASSAYLVDTAQGRICLNDDEDWPPDVRTHSGGVIRFVAGYGTAATDVPQPLRLAVYQLMTHYFENADPVGDFDRVNMAYAAHIAPYRYSGGIA